jgi:prepilin-type N-terminal cleavage/methylation domain-containing protein
MKAHRSGFTLVELLVAIAIIGILIAMLLPAVQSSREAARMTSCGNNIRQIAIAVIGYESAHQHAPAGWKSSTGMGWMSYSLPYIEQDNLYQKFRRDLPLVDPINQVPAKTFIAGQFCPTSTNNSQTHDLEVEGGPVSNVEIGRTHYVGSIGSSVQRQSMADGQTCPSLDLVSVTGRLDGMFYRDSKVPFRDVTDGLSNTILAGERSGDLFDSSWPGVIDGSTYTGWRVVGWTGEPPNNPMRIEPIVVVNEDGEEETLEIHFHGFAQFNSQHFGMTMFCLSDGSTHAIDDEVDPVTFRALGTISAHDKIGDY